MGTTPWSALVFLTLYFQLLGMSDAAASLLMAAFLASNAAGEDTEGGGALLCCAGQLFCWGVATQCDGRRTMFRPLRRRPGGWPGG